MHYAAARAERYTCQLRHEAVDAFFSFMLMLIARPARHTSSRSRGQQPPGTPAARDAPASPICVRRQRQSSFIFIEEDGAEYDAIIEHAFFISMLAASWCTAHHLFHCDITCLFLPQQ